MYYHTEFGRSRSNGMGVVGGPSNWGRWDQPSWDEGVADPKKHAPPIMRYPANLFVLGQTVLA